MRAKRLKRRSDFLNVAQKGHKWVTPGLVLQVLKQKESDTQKDHKIRIGFTVTRKVGNAVIRNRVKRRLRSLCDELLALNQGEGFDLVLIGRRTTITRNYDSLRADLAKALKKTGVCVDATL